MRIVRELRAGLVHVDPNNVALLMKVLPEQLDGAAFFDANLLITFILKRMCCLTKIKSKKQTSNT